MEREYWECRKEVLRRQETQIKELKTKFVYGLFTAIRVLITHRVSMTGLLGAREVEVRIECSLQTIPRLTRSDTAVATRVPAGIIRFRAGWIPARVGSFITATAGYPVPNRGSIDVRDDRTRRSESAAADSGSLREIDK